MLRFIGFILGSALAAALLVGLVAPETFDGAGLARLAGQVSGPAQGLRDVAPERDRTVLPLPPVREAPAPSEVEGSTTGHTVPDPLLSSGPAAGPVTSQAAATVGPGAGSDSGALRASGPSEPDAWVAATTESFIDPAGAEVQTSGNPALGPPAAETAENVRTDARRPDATRAGAARPDATRPDATRADATRSGAAIEGAATVVSAATGAVPPGSALSGPGLPGSGASGFGTLPPEIQSMPADDSAGWQPVWLPFHSERSARGFAGRLASLTGFDFRITQVERGIFQVDVSYTTPEERHSRLLVIEDATGLDLGTVTL